MPAILQDARRLANFLESVNVHGHYQPASCRPVYNHLGALLTDIVLQSGLNYQTVVRPRVTRVLVEFPYASTTPLIQSVVKVYGAHRFLNWRNQIKINRLLKVLNYLNEYSIYDEHQFCRHLLIDQHKKQFLHLEGIGPKTADYALKLMGVECVAVDRHIYSFVRQAGIESSEYSKVKMIVEYAADLLCLSRSHVDQFIWSSMNKRSRQTQTSLDFQG